jgi:hypothetical protein
VDQAVSANHEVADYVKRLEAAYDDSTGDDDNDGPVDLPDPIDAISDIEDFLRRQREN